MDDKGNAPLLETIDLKKYFKVGGVRLRKVHIGPYNPQAY